jgi:hypothetical protein
MLFSRTSEVAAQQVLVALRTFYQKFLEQAISSRRREGFNPNLMHKQIIT